ncbi:MAG: DUF4270 family protein [Crocinitomicaceae bacterium]
MNNHSNTYLGRKVLTLSATFFALIILIIGCKKEETDIGSNLDEGNLNVLTTDTFTIRTYTEVYDSMESDETSVTLLGAYNDPIFGGVNCGFVTQIVPEAYTQDFPDLVDLTVDSVVLALRFTSINYYANLEDMTVEVFEIDDVLERDDQVYYTFEEPTIISGNLVDSEPMVVTPDFVKDVIVGNDTLEPQIRIRLNPAIGEELVADSKAGLMGESFPTSTFKGLYVRIAVDEEAPRFGLAEGQGTVVYLSLENLLSKMTMYYKGASGISEQFDFDINSTCARYNKISYERSGTTVEAAIEGSANDGNFYVQGGNLRGVVEIPYIEQFYLDADGNFTPRIINKAELILPVQDFQPDLFNPTTNLFLARIVDVKTSTFTQDYGFGTSVSGNTITYDEANKEFRFTLTREIQAILNGEVESEGYRIYPPAFFASTIERIVFNGVDNESLKDRPRLEITYTEY